MNHYFEYNSSLISKERNISFKIKELEISLVSDVNVFSNSRIDEGSFIFINYLLGEDLDGEVLDLGCGYGVIGISLKLLYTKLNLKMSDVNPLCTKLTDENLKKYHLDDVSVILSNSYSSIDNHFDIVLLNPPISCGKKVIYKMYDETYEHLNENGRFYLVIRKDKGALSHLKYLSTLFKKVDIVKKEKGYYILKAIKETKKKEQ